MDKVRQKVEISENFEIIGSSEKNIRRYWKIFQYSYLAIWMFWNQHRVQCKSLMIEKVSFLVKIWNDLFIL